MNKINKILTLIFIIFSLTITSKAQDKIITTTGDTINCKIIEISSTIITYEQVLQDNSISGRFISINNVIEYIRDAEVLSNSTEMNMEMNQEIEIKKHGITKQYFQNGQKLTLKNMMVITRNNPDAYQYMNSAHKYMVTSSVCGYIGGFGIGYYIGYLFYGFIASSDRIRNPAPTIISLAIFGTGVVLIGFNVIFEYHANKLAIKGVNIYNKKY